MTEQVKWFKCISGGAMGIEVGDVRKAWEEGNGIWRMEDPIMPLAPWYFDITTNNLCQLDCYFEEITEEEAPTTEVSIEPDVRSLECFKQVADVLGEEAAEVELVEAIEAVNHWPDDEDSLVAAFVWSETPQGGSFWNDIDDGITPEDYVPLDEQEENTVEAFKELSEPKFGDMLHVNKELVVVIGTSVRVSQTDFIKLYTTVSVSGFKADYLIADFDEHMPDKTQELREQILMDWKWQGIDFAYDTEESEYVMHLSDVIDFIVEQGYSKGS